MPMQQQPSHDPFYGSSMVAAPPQVQMAAMANQQQAFMMQQQLMMGVPHQHPSPNPFDNNNPYGPTNHYSLGVPVQAYNPYSGLI